MDVVITTHGWRDYLPLHAVGPLAFVAWHLRDPAIAAPVYQRAIAEQGRPEMTTSFGFTIGGVFDHDLMRLASVLGRHDEVDRFAASALALCDRLGAAPLARQIREDHATIVAERAGSRAEKPTPAPVVPSPAAIVSALREGEFWTVSGFGELCRIKDSRGMQMLARLIASPHQELHALDLSGAELVDAGDAGELLDASARTAYRNRLRELQEELAEAEQWNDSGRRERIAHEIEALTTQLSGAIGLGNRERRSGGASERARQNVRRRIADAMQRIADACPALGRHLERTIRTGTTCVYAPDG